MCVSVCVCVCCVCVRLEGVLRRKGDKKIGEGREIYFGQYFVKFVYLKKFKFSGLPRDK